MPEYKLIYFNGRGRAELIRWICLYADIPFTEERVERADWAERKPSIPGGKLPVLMVDGEPLLQSLTIARYMAKVGGLVPEDDLEAAHCDALADTFNDVMAEFYKVFFGSGNEEQEKKYNDEIYPNVIVPVLERLEKRFANEKYFIANKMTWSDLTISAVFGEIQMKRPDVLKGFPNVESHIKEICSNPKIKAWLDKRPQTEF